ncbi:MAG: polyhydroxyalkanoate synthesis repressor PhaR, partial [Sphingomonadales bacterium]
MTATEIPQPEPVVIKKYANRRLYNTETSSYVTLEYLSQMIKDGREFVVRDAKTGNDITRAVLTQIIFEEEAKSGQTLLPVGFLRQLISYYGHGLESVVPTYLESALEMFARNQERYCDYFQQQITATNPFAVTKAFAPFEELARQNLA